MKILDVLTSPWAIQPEKLQEITDVYARHMKGDKIDIRAIEAKAGQPFESVQQGYDVIDGVAVIPVHGVIAKRMNLLHQISGGASTELVGRDLRAALADADVKSIVLHIDSPGGTVDGTADLGDLIYSARGTKPIVAFADGLMASAAYWIGSAADRIVASNATATIGSIGVVATHSDYSKYYEQHGVNVTEIYAGKFKRIASEYKPLSADGKKNIQEHVDYLYSIFVGAVAKNRGVDVQTVLNDMADGRLFVGQQAVDAGLVDGVSTLESLIAELNGSFTPQERERAIHIIESEMEANNMPDVEITKTYILDSHPDIAAALREEGKASVDVSKIVAEAADAERSRIKSVMDQTMPGHEALVMGLAFDGKTTGPEAAVKVLAAERTVTTKRVADLHEDGADLAKVPASAGDNVVSGWQDVSKLPTDQKCKAEWDRDPDLRAEFNDDFSSYLSYSKAMKDGLVKTLGDK